MEIVQLLLGIARLGYCGAISERCLSALVAQAKDHGVPAVLGWITDDPGLLVVPSVSSLPLLFLFSWPVGRNVS